MSFEGSHDSANCRGISGWARDRSNPDATVSVEILVDGLPFARIDADQFRPDLLDAGIGNGCHAFRFPIDFRLRDGKPHQVSVRIVGTDILLPNTPKSLHCTTGLPDPLPRQVMEQAIRNAETERMKVLAPGKRLRSHQPAPMRIHIVCYEALDEWILGKIATKLADSLARMGMAVTIGNVPDPSAEVNHHIIYWGYVDRKSTLETVMITHIDSYGELAKVQHQLSEVGVELGICMSFEAVHRLAQVGIPRHQLAFVHPAHDALMRPRKLVVGITTRVYDDGCKREHLVAELAAVLPPDHFRFRIMGTGWEIVVGILRERGIEVEYTGHFDRDAYLKMMPELDYYLYTGLDEGSMGFVDAIAAGVQTIVTPQGYHLDAPGGITHPFRDFDDLQRIFAEIAAEREARAATVAGWTWDANARRHALLWEYLLFEKRGVPIPDDLRDELVELAVIC